MNILIVDGSALVCERLIKMLSELKNIKIISQARNTLEAIQVRKKINPDVVILDIRLPDGSGFDVLQDIKKSSVRTVVIILTNFTYPIYQRKCMELGAKFFFNKSTDFDKIPEILKQLIRDSETGKSACLNKRLETVNTKKKKISIWQSQQEK